MMRSEKMALSGRVEPSRWRNDDDDDDDGGGDDDDDDDGGDDGGTGWMELLSTSFIYLLTYIPITNNINKPVPMLHSSYFCLDSRQITTTQSRHASA